MTRKSLAPTRRKVLLTRVYRFNAGHRLFDPSHDEAWNRKVFGKCSYPGGHGHNYTLWVTIAGYACPLTGWMLDLGRLDELFEKKVMDWIDHRNLNDILELDLGPAPTTEVLIVEIWRQLVDHIPALGSNVARLEAPEHESFDTETRLHHLKISETFKNSFEYWGE